MNWIRFDAQRPPEDTTVMVSNGPAMGYYHYKKYLHDKALSIVEDDGFRMKIWTLDGKMELVGIKDLIQWAHMLPVKAREIKRLSRFQRIKQWFKELV